jgi:hypothetical protein
MGLLASFSLVLYGQMFDLMRWLMSALAPTDSGYVLYLALGALIPSIIMAPPAFFAGMTLPLITHHLLRTGEPESSIGSVYAWNTVGAIVGVLIATHAALPAIGLKYSIALGAAIDIGVGLFLLWYFVEGSRPFLVTSASVVAFLACVGFSRLDPLEMASGVFRSGQTLDPGRYKVVFSADGSTASVAVLSSDSGVSIRTNGKADALIQMTPGRPPRAGRINHDSRRGNPARPARTPGADRQHRFWVWPYDVHLSCERPGKTDRYG